MRAEEIVDRLRDIRDLDAISPWPPGPGWWWLALGAVLALLLLSRLPLRRSSSDSNFATKPPDGDWRKSATAALKSLRTRVGNEDPKSISSELSELLRRIAIARCGREACASLTGSAWLGWLKQQDPKDYDWPTRGRLLISAPYAPHNKDTKIGDPARPDANPLDDQLVEMIDAALHWSRSKTTARTRQGTEQTGA